MQKNHMHTYTHIHAYIHMHKQSVQMQPSVLPQLLQEIGRSDPPLLAEINANQADFIRMINEPVTQEEFSEAMRRVRYAYIHAYIHACMHPYMYMNDRRASETGGVF